MAERSLGDPGQRNVSDPAEANSLIPARARAGHAFEQGGALVAVAAEGSGQAQSLAEGVRYVEDGIQGAIEPEKIAGVAEDFGQGLV